jgi:hypothetical protein
LGAGLAAAVAIGGCGGSTGLTADAAANAPVSPLTKSIESFVHAFSVQSQQCGQPGSHGRRSCQVEFTDEYGVWYATLIVAGSKVVSDPGGVSDWLCASACANPPPMRGNTGKPAGSSGSTAASGETGVTGIGGVVRPHRPAPVHVHTTTVPATPESVTSASGVVSGSGSSGVVSGSGSTGTGNSSGIVYGTGSTGAPSGSTGTRTGRNGVVYPTGGTG